MHLETATMALHENDNPLQTGLTHQPSEANAAVSSSTSSSRVTSPSLPKSPTADSKIPRPAPIALQRSASFRHKNERSLNGGSYQSLRHCKSGGSHQHIKHLLSPQENCPVIKENGVDSPGRVRSTSLSLTPARPRFQKSNNSRSSSGTGCHYDDCSDLDSVKSYGSNFSTVSACDHATFALNGTTWSGRSKKYVVHCSNYGNDGDEYLTPTQRAARQIRRFQTLLKEARKDIEEKEKEIQRLTKEVVELRLYKASLNSPEDRTDSSDAPTVRENKSSPNSPKSPSKELNDEILCVVSTSSASPRTPERRLGHNYSSLEPSSSLVDSGHFEDGSLHSKESLTLVRTPNDDSSNTDSGISSMRDQQSPYRDEEKKRIVNLYELRIEEMHRRHVDEIQMLKESHNDKVETLLIQLSDVNTRFLESRPSLEKAEARTKELEEEIEKLKAELAEAKALLAQQEENNKQMYLRMYIKGQEAAKIEETGESSNAVVKTKLEVSELLRQLTVTQAELENLKPPQEVSLLPEPRLLTSCNQSLLGVQEAVSLWVLGTRKVMYRRILESRNQQKVLDPEITLQFLKSAVYYFLTDRENLHRHLNAIENILGFTDTEKGNIDKIFGTSRK